MYMWIRPKIYKKNQWDISVTPVRDKLLTIFNCT